MFYRQQSPDVHTFEQIYVKDLVVFPFSYDDLSLNKSTRTNIHLFDLPAATTMVGGSLSQTGCGVGVTQTH